MCKDKRKYAKEIQMSRKKKNNNNTLLRTIIYILILAGIWYLSKYTDIFAFENEETKEAVVVEGKLEMHAIDVGQGDSILLLQNNKVMLVDSGPRASGKKVVEYLQNLGIKKIDILVGTHPHEDHIGGMAEVINNFDIGVLYTPNYDDTNITTTYYMKFLDAVHTKNVKWQYKKAKDKFKLGDASVLVLAPQNNYYEEVNNYSLVLKVTFGEVDIMLTGDAEELIENEIMENNKNIECEILKLGHHGSSTSSTEKFLKAVNPNYAIISAGVANDYHHPHPSIVNRLKKLKIVLYRTDEQGDIVMTTDGENIEFNKKKGSYLTGDELYKRRNNENSRDR